MNKKNDVEDSTYIINVINTDLSCSLLNQKDKNHDDCSFNKLLENKMFVRVSKAFIMVFMIAGVEIGKLYITVKKKKKMTKELFLINKNIIYKI